jgi:hypothetical protein
MLAYATHSKALGHVSEANNTSPEIRGLVQYCTRGRKISAFSNPELMLKVKVAEIGLSTSSLDILPNYSRMFW